MTYLPGKKELIYNHFKYRTLLRCHDEFKPNLELSNFFSKYFDKVKRIASEPLNLAVMGEFSVGKSSFINKLLDIDFLPIGITPITSVITTIKYGESEKVEVHYYKDNEHVEIVSYNSYSILRDYQRASEIDNEVYRREVESIKEIVVYLDNENLKKFNIIDTPGFNHSELCDEITKNLFDRLDFVVWIFDAAQAGKLTESVLLNELFEKVNNVYAVINKIDIVELSEIKQTSIDLNDKLTENYTGKFINHSNIHCISVKKSEGEFNLLYNGFIDDFNNSVIDRDYHISSQEIESIYDEIQLQLEQIQSDINSFQEQMNLLLTDFIDYGKTEDYKDKADKLSQEIYTVIIDVIKETVMEISGSKIFRELSAQNPALKFYCLYRTFENIRNLKFLIGDVYLEYLNLYKEKFLSLDAEIEDVIKKVSYLCPESLKNEMKEILYYNKSIINGFIAKKHKLATTGYMFGLLSDNFIYEKFLQKQKKVDQGGFVRNFDEMSQTFVNVKESVKTKTFNPLYDLFVAGDNKINPEVVKKEGGNGDEKGLISDVSQGLNREIIMQIFKIDLETIEVEEKLSDLKDKITVFTEIVTGQIERISQELQVTKC